MKGSRPWAGSYQESSFSFSWDEESPTARPDETPAPSPISTDAAKEMPLSPKRQFESYVEVRSFHAECSSIS